MAKRIIALEVEGMGYASGGSTYPWRWCVQSPTLPGTVLAASWRSGMLLPSAVGATIDPIALEASYSGITVDLPAGSTDRAEWWRSFTSPVAYLSNAIDADDLLIVFSGAITGGIIWIDRECLRYDGAGVVVRAQLGTRASSHEAGALVFEQNPIVAGRRATLTQYADTGLSGSLLWAGQVQEVTSGADPASVRVACVSQGRWLDAPICLTRLRYSVYTPGSGQVGPGLYILDQDQDPSAGWIDQPVLSEMIRRRDGAYGSSLEPGMVVKIGDSLLRARRSNSGSTNSQFLAVTNPALRGEPIEGSDGTSLPRYCREVLTTDDPAYNPFMVYDLNAAGLANTLNPFRIALIILCSTGDSTFARPQGWNYDAAYSDYSYDTLPHPYGQHGIPVGHLDMQTWEDYAREHEDFLADRVFIEGTETAEEVVRRLLGPLGFMVVAGASGYLIPVRLTDPTSAGSYTTITTDDLEEPVSALARGMDRIIEIAEVDWDDGSEPDQVLDEASGLWYPTAAKQQMEIDARYYSALGLMADRILAIASETVSRYRWPPPIFTCAIGIDSTIGVGSAVLLSHDVLPGPSGSATASGLGCFCVDAELDFDSAAKRLTLWAVAHDLPRTALIGPCCRVRSYVIASKTVTIWSGTYTEYYDLARFTVAHELRLLTANGYPRSDPSQGVVTVSSIPTDTTMVLSADFLDSGANTIYPRADDVIAIARYDEANGSTEHDKHDFMADSTGKLGAADDDPYLVMG